MHCTLYHYSGQTLVRFIVALIAFRFPAVKIMKCGTGSSATQRIRLQVNPPSRYHPPDHGIPWPYAPDKTRNAANGKASYGHDMS
ncbi:hypothetical protein [Gaoshiqia sediminis]|uniref:Uncharacterized protein n=1 Tax=Gaoshiqia sediminis TaxID=2986998 RepID=A0AA41Y835_9BACT|nr:hypothetical protein [Gaoshiqia sediminis]MCW0483600.1 hypothetical protein [Gaoshiqia sediminis]